MGVKEHLLLKSLTMIDPVTEWVEITQYNDKKTMTIVNLVKTLWLSRYPCSDEIMYDCGS